MFSSPLAGRLRRFHSCFLRTTSLLANGGADFHGGDMTYPTFPQYPFIAAKQRCWSCDERRARSDVGLCGECRDRLIEEGRDEK